MIVNLYNFKDGMKEMYKMLKLED